MGKPGDGAKTVNETKSMSSAHAWARNRVRRPKFVARRSPVTGDVLSASLCHCRCPNRVVGGEYSDDGQEAMMCLLCGKLLCTNSYCCLQTVELENKSHPVRIGGFTHHIQRCVCMCVSVCVRRASVPV